MTDITETLIENRKEIVSALTNGTNRTTAWGELQRKFPGIGAWNAFRPKLPLFLAFCKKIDEVEAKGRKTDRRVKRDGKNAKVDGWNVVESGGYFRAFRRLNGKLQGVYIGKVFDPEKAREKIRKKEKKLFNVKH